MLPKEQKRKRRGIRKVAFEGAARVGPYTTSGMSASLVRLATDTTTFYEQLTELQWKAEFYTHSESECITSSCNICVVIWADCGCDCPDVTGCCCITYQACQSAATERPHHEDCRIHIIHSRIQRLLSRFSLNVAKHTKVEWISIQHHHLLARPHTSIITLPPNHLQPKMSSPQTKPSEPQDLTPSATTQSKDPSTPPCAVTKQFESCGEWTLHRLEAAQQFTCTRCTTAKKAKLIAIKDGRWDDMCCNACYGNMLSK